MSRVTLGVDASLRRPGFAVIGRRGELLDWRAPAVTTNGLAAARALADITVALASTHLVELVAVESSAGIQFIGRNALSVDTLPWVRGVVAGVVALAPIWRLAPMDLVEYRPSEIRAAMLGSRWGGTAGKASVIGYLGMRGYELPRGPRGVVLDDVADALLIALYAQALDDVAVAGAR